MNEIILITIYEKKFHEKYLFDFEWCILEPLPLEDFAKLTSPILNSNLGPPLISLKVKQDQSSN